jgi:hypothetical protein
MNPLLKVGVGIFAVLIFVSSCSNCSRSNKYRSQSTYNVTVQQTVGSDAADGLDLQAVGNLVKRAEDAAMFERVLNDPDTGLNNLDLDENNQVDYIQVTEYGSGNLRGFSLTVDLSGGQTQEVATIEIEKSSDGAHIQTYGNSHIYGSNHYYHSRTSLTDVLIIGWLFSGNRSFYHSPWGYNRYPSYYNGYAPRSYDSYRRNVSNSTQGSSFSKGSASQLSSTATSPNAGKNATNIKAPLKSPSTAQKSFQARNPSKSVKSGGFGRSSKPSPSVRSSSSYRSGSSRGGGK